MTSEERAHFEELFTELHVKALRQCAEHFLKNFRGEVDVLDGKYERLRRRVEKLEKDAAENAPTAHG